jgi:hypothetical protein
MNWIKFLNEFDEDIISQISPVSKIEPLSDVSNLT